MAKQPFFINQKFSSYDEIDISIATYEESSGHRLSISDSRKNKDKNEFEFAYKVYKCVKSGDAAKSKGRGLRNKPSQKMNCPFVLRVKLTKVKKGAEVQKDQNDKEVQQFLMISQLNLIHNHSSDYEPIDSDSCTNEQLFTTELNVSDRSVHVDAFDNYKLSDSESELSNQNLLTSKDDFHEDANKIDISTDTSEKIKKTLKQFSEVDLNQDNPQLIQSTAKMHVDVKEKNVVEQNTENHDQLKQLKKGENLNEHVEIKETIEEKLVTVTKTTDIRMPQTQLKEVDKIVIEENSKKPQEMTTDKKTVTQNADMKMTRGRPKGASKTAIGLPMKKEITPFVSLSEKGKLRRILQWLSYPASIIDLILSEEYVVKHDDLKEKLTKLSDSFLADDIDIDIFQKFFEPKALRFFKIAIVKFRKNAVYTCKSCESTVADEENSIACDSCLTWFHAKCVGIKLTKKVETKNWFCKFCAKK